MESTTRFWSVHGGTAAAGAGLLAWDAVSTGAAVWVFVILYNLLWAIWTYRADDPEAFRLWSFLLPLSLLQIFPDWFLVDPLGVLSFADHQPAAGPVPGYMALMWTYPLVMTTHAGLAVRRRFGTNPARLAVVLAGLVIFGSSELMLTRIPIWEAHEVATYRGAALYILAAEAFLSLTAFEAFRQTRHFSRLARLVAAFLVMVGYLGAAALSYLAVEIIL